MNVATLTIEMAANVARLQQDMSRAASTVDGAMGKIRKSADMAMVALGAIGVGLSVAGLSNWVRSGIDAADATSKLAQKTGLLTKEVAGLQLAFDQGGAGEKMQQALSRLSKEAANGNKAFAAMGVEVTGAGGKLKSTRELIGEVASKFASYADDGKKAALASKLFGDRVGADLIPVLNGGAEALAAYDETARALGLTLDEETAKSAEKFNDTLDLLGQSTTGVATQLAGKLLPTLNAMAGELVGAMTNADFLSGATTALAAAFKGLYSVGVGVVTAFKTVGTALGGVGAAIAAVLSGEFGQVRGIVSNMASDISASWASAGGSIQRVWSETANSTVAAMVAINGEAKRSAPSVEALAGSHGKAASATKEHAEALRALLAAAKSNNDAFDEEFNRIEAAREATEGRIRSGREMLEGIQRETALLGLSNVEREKAIALFELERAGVVAGTEAYAAYADEISRAIEARAGKQAAIDLAESQTKAYEDSLKEQKAATDKFWGSVDSTAHDVFVSVANEGEDAFKRIGKTLKAAILDMLYQMTIKKWIFQISGSLSGGGGGTNWIDLAQQAYSAYSGTGATSAGIAAGAGTVNTTTMAGVSAASAGSTGVAGGTAAAASTGTASSTLAAGGYTGYGYLGYAALIAAAVMVAENLYEKGYTRAAVGVGDKERFTYGNGNLTSAGRNEGGSRLYQDSAENFNRQLLGAFGVNNKWADILSGTTRMAALFGRKLKEYGFEADIAGGNISVSGYEKYKGGVFRSNKTINTEVNTADAAALQTQIAGWIEGNRAMARALGYSEEAIDSYTGSVRINFKGAKTGAEIAERYAEAQEKLQREMLSAASGTKISEEAFKQMMDGINASIQNAGISAQGIGDILAQGAIGRLTQAQVGEQLSEVIIGGIYNTIAQNAMAPVAEIFMSAIITPIFTAIMAGVPISQAVSQAAIQQVVATAQSAAAALNAILADASFQQAIAEIQGAIGSVSRVSVSSARHVRSFGTAVNTAGQAAQAAAQERKTLETQLLTLQGNTAELRRRERNALAPSNRALFDRVKALEDEKAILDERANLQRQIYELRGDTLAIEALERNALNAANRGLYDETLRLQKINDIRDAWGDLLGSVRSEIEQLKEDILGESPAGSAYAQAQFAIATAQAQAAYTSGDSAAARAAAERLPELARAVVDMAEASASSLTEYRIAQGTTLDSLSATQRMLAERFGIDIPGFAVGTNYVPRDMVAQIHQGEAIVPKAYNPAAGGQSELVAEVRALRGEVERLRTGAFSAIEKNTRQTANVLTEVSGGSGTFLTKAVA
jgi:hypothetical protein